MTKPIDALVSASSEARLSRAARFVGRFPPATEVIVIGPSRGAVDDLVRRVATTGGASRATFGLHRKTLAGLMTELAAPRLADRGRSPATRLALAAVVASIAASALASRSLEHFGPRPGRRGVAEAPSFPRALHETLLDLRRHRVQPARLREGTAAERDLATLLEAYERALAERGLADVGDIAVEALVGAADHPLTRSPFALVDVALRTESEREVVRTLLAQAPEACVVAPRGDDTTLRALGEIGLELETDASPPRLLLERAQRYLFSSEAETTATSQSPSAEDAPSSDESVLLVSAPSEGHEMVEIARRVVALAGRGVPFDAIAIAVPSRATYAQHLETALARADVPAYFSFGTRRPLASGRALCALLACKLERYSARRFAEYLSLGQVPDERRGSPEAALFLAPHDEALGRFGEGATPIDDDDDDDDDATRSTEGGAETKRWGRVRAPRRWERLLGEASTLEVVTNESGRAYYERRLRALRATLSRARDAVARDDPSSARLGSLERDLADVDELGAFAGPILEACDRLPERAPWEAWIDACGELARLSLRKPEPILAVLTELLALGGSPPVTLSEVLEILEARLVELDRPPPSKRFGRVFVTTPRDMRGRSFRVVFVPGLTERVFPARLREDPLLDDHARRSLSPWLAHNDQRSADERLALLSSIGAATELAVLSYPRVEAELGRPRVPSFYALDVARAIGGRLPDVDEMQRRAAAAADARLDWPAPRAPEDAIDELEHDLAVLRSLLDAPAEARPEGRARYVLEENAHLARALRARFSRFDRNALGPNDGLVRLGAANLAALAVESPRARAYSASALQLFAACPYRFYLSAILRLAPREVPDRVESLDPATRGDLFHRVAATLTHELVEEGALPIDEERLPAVRERLRALFDADKRALADALQPVVPRVFEDDCAEVLADLEALVASDWSDASAWSPIRADLGFGVPRGEHVDRTGPKDPVTLPGGYLLRGAIDAVERHRASGKLRVTDYKTGALHQHGALTIGQGEVLQPVLYSLAVTAMRGDAFPADAEVVEARLAYATKRGGFEDRVVRIDADAISRATRALETIDEATTRGFLVAKPRRDACKSCDYRPICGRHEEARTARKTAASPEDKRHLDALADLRRQP